MKDIEVSVQNSGVITEVGTITRGKTRVRTQIICCAIHLISVPFKTRRSPTETVLVRSEMATAIGEALVESLQPPTRLPLGARLPPDVHAGIRERRRQPPGSPVPRTEFARDLL